MTPDVYLAYKLFPLSNTRAFIECSEHSHIRMIQKLHIHCLIVQKHKLTHNKSVSSKEKLITGEPSILRSKIFLLMCGRQMQKRNKPARNSRYLRECGYRNVEGEFKT